jgi:SAM-dependent methyltransferase
MTLDPQGLEELAMWAQWQEVVRQSRPLFCKDRVYVAQAEYLPEFEEVAEYVMTHNPVDLDGRIRDAEFGGLVGVTKAAGPVTRMWLDSNIEIDFLRRHLGLRHVKVLDVGAGYGRLAAAMWELVDAYYCVDAVPISTELCHKYTERFGWGIEVLSLPDFVRRADALEIDLAINVHSFNECSLAQIARWLDVLREMRVPWLFTVSHGDHLAYFSYDLKSWRPLLGQEYDLVAEEFIGLGKCPHALWKRKA